jgi:hypothetical protein
MKFKAGKGHLRNGSLHLKQTKESRERMGKGRQVAVHLKQLKPAALNWKGK